MKIEDIKNILFDNTKHFERIYFNILSTKILLKKNKPEDFFICPPKMYATDLILKSVYEMEKLLDNMKEELLILKKVNVILFVSIQIFPITDYFQHFRFLGIDSNS